MICYLYLFMIGMRGKKDNLDQYLDVSNIQNDYQLLETLAAEQDLLHDIERLYQLQHYGDVNGNALLTHEELNHMPQGFSGIRGKKFYSEDGSDSYDFNDNYLGDKVDKRDPNAGFFGMRGKKSFDDDEYSHEDKRVPMGFHGETFILYYIHSFYISRYDENEITFYFL